jgi:transposase
LASFTLNTKPIIKITDFGLPVALMQIVEKLDLITAINRYSPKRNQGLSLGHYIALDALNRCIKPKAKENFLGWFQTTFLQQMFPAITTYLDAAAYTNHYAYLTDRIIQQIQAEINLQLVAKFNINMKQLIYDPTNFYTFMNPDGDDCLAKHGHSKENRATLNIIGLALICTKDGGIPILYDVYSGNLQDSTVFQAEVPTIIKQIQALDQDETKTTLTFDKGNNSDTIFAQFDAAQITFIASIRPSMLKQYDDVKAEDFPRFTLPNGKPVGIKDEHGVLYGKDRRILVLFNPEQMEWSGNTFYRKLKADVNEVEEFFHFKHRLNKGKWRTVDNVQKKITEIVGPAHLPYLRIKITDNEKEIQFQIAINEEQINEHVASLGKSYLITNDFSASAVDLIATFRQQITIERAFSYLKSPDLVPVRPIFDSNDQSIQGHLFSSVLGLLILMLLTREVQSKYPEMSVEQVHNNLSQVQLASVITEGTTRPLRSLVEMSEDARKLVDYLKLEALL